ncbi:MAG: hypothetical protein ACM3SW_05490 [Actinomycetota bacterium]
MRPIGPAARAKRSPRAKKPRLRRAGRGKERKPATRSSRREAIYLPPGSLEFPHVRGKTLAQVYLTSDPDCHQVTLTFNDKTELVVDVEPRVAFSAEYSDWKTGDQRVIRRWKP